MNTNRRRVVITGLGIVSSVGIGKEAFWKSLVAGKSGIKGITNFDASQYPCQVAGEVANFDPLNYIPKKEADRMDRSTQFAVAAAEIAVKDAQLDLDREDSKRIGVAIGTTIGGAGFSYEQHLTFLKRGPMKIHPYTASITWPNACSTWVSINLKAKGPSETISTACVSSFDAIFHGTELIRNGEMNLVVCGGAESPLFPMFYSAFCLSKIVSNKNSGSMRVPRPFDNQRDGTILGEGAGVLILEDLEHALKRNAFIYSELTGYGVTCDASHVVRPNYKGISRAIQMALDEAGVSPGDVDYIHATGSGTRAGDLVETIAIKDALGRHAYRIPISTIKSMIGHTMGASGAIELAACILALTNGVIPPTINHEYPDPDCDLDYVPNKSRIARIHTALANSFGFGGKNTAVVVERCSMSRNNDDLLQQAYGKP